MPISADAAEGRTFLLEDLSTGDTERLERIDAVVAGGGISEDRLYHELRGRVVVNCVAPRTALEAIYEGHAAGWAV